MIRAIIAGVVLKDSLYIIGCKEETAQAVIRRFNLCTCKWDSVPMPDCLSAGHTSLLAANNQELILFGECCLQYCAVRHTSPVLRLQKLHMCTFLSILQAEATLRAFAMMTSSPLSTQAAPHGSSIV